MILIAKKSHACEVTKPEPILEDSFQTLIRGYENPEVLSTTEYHSAWEHVLGVLCAMATGLFQRWCFPNPRLAGEDVAIECAIAMLTGGFENCDKSLPFVPFAWTVCYCKCANYRRTAKRKRLIVSDSLEPESNRAKCTLEAEELSATVRRALDGLPPHYRDAVISQYFERLSATRAASMYGTTAGNMRLRRFRGRKLLAVLLRDFDRSWHD